MVQKDSLGNESWANETNFSEDDGKLGKKIETDNMDKTNSSIQVFFAPSSVIHDYLLLCFR